MGIQAWLNEHSVDPHDFDIEAKNGDRLRVNSGLDSLLPPQRLNKSLRWQVTTRHVCMIVWILVLANMC